MGGKHKGQAQRTKNNTKASTSGRSAELINSNISILPGFSNVVQEDFSSVVMSKVTINENESTINSDYQLAIKKMGKKDSTTKLKALQEFTALVDKSDVSEVIPVLPIWSKMYCTLAMDTEHRVREAAQVSHGAVVTKCGKALAPHLKHLAPAWLMSQYDTFAPAATQAQLSLQNVFPSEKLPDVISFCRVELVGAISKNLLVQTPATIASVKSCTPEESEAVYQRMVIASLQGYSLMIKHLSVEHSEWFCGEQELILKDKKFWKLAKHKNPQIRSAWYITIGCQCDKQAKWFGEKYASQTLHILVNNLNEEDSTVAPNIWDCLLMLMAIKDTWSDGVEINKIISDQLCTIVLNAGHGSATKLAPVLLPLLAHLPNSLRTFEFYSRFFENVIKGIDQRSILSSKIEGTAWLSGLSECLRFVSMEEEASFTSQLVPVVVRSWLQKAIQLRRTQNTLHIFRQSISNAASLARFWTKQSISAPTQHFAQLSRLFWQNIRFIFTTEMEKLQTAAEDIKMMTDTHIELLLDLKHSVPIDKKQVKVKFMEESNADPKLKRSASSSADTDDKTRDLYDRDLLCFASEMASAYLKYALNKNTAVPILSSLYSILSDFDKVEIFNAMYHSIFPESTSVQLIKLYTDLWHSWLTGDSMRCHSVIDLVFLLLKYLDSDAQSAVFTGFNQFAPSVIEMCISKCLCHPHSNNPIAKTWLNSDVVSESLVLTCKQLIQNGDRKKATLLKMCFAEDNNGDILIGDKSCAAIINTISESLPTIRSKHLDMCASFASQLAPVSVKDPSITTSLILSMIRLNMSVKAGSEHLSMDTWWEVNIAWQDAIQSSSQKDFQVAKLVAEAERIIHESLQIMNNGVVDSEQIEVITGIAADLIISLVSIVKPDERVQMLHSYYEKIAGVAKAEMEELYLNIYNHSIVFDLIRDHLNVPFVIDDDTVKSVLKRSANVYNEDLDNDHLKTYLLYCLFSTKLINRIVLPLHHKSKTFVNDDGEEECYEPDKVLWTTDYDMFKIMQDYVMELLHRSMVLESLFRTHQSWQYYSTISSVYPELEQLQMKIIDSAIEMDDRRAAMSQYLQDKADSQGLYWSKALYFYKKRANDPFYPKWEGNDIEEYNLPGTERQNQVFSTMLPKSLDSFGVAGLFYNLQASINVANNNIDPFIVMSVTGIIAIRSLPLVLRNDKGDAVLKFEDIDKCFIEPLGCLTVIVNKYYIDKTIMLYERDISDANWVFVQSNVSILRYVTHCVKFFGWHINDTQWDFITISLTMLLKSLRQSMAKWRCLKWSTLCCSVFDLYNEVKVFVHSIQSRCLKSAPSDIVANLPGEWKDIFEPDINEDILQIILHIFDEYIKISDLKLTTKESFVIAHIGKTIDENILKHQNKKTSMDAVLKSCLNVLSSTRHHSLKYTAYKLLKNCVSSLVIHDTNILNSLSEGSEEYASLPELVLKKIEPSLVHVQDLLVILSPYKICDDSCAFEPFTDSYSIALGYLLIWNIINSITSSVTGDLMHQYAEFLKAGKYVEDLCSNTFKMLPSGVIHRKETGPVDPQLQAKFDNFIEIRYDEPITSSLVSSAACSVLADTMSGIASGAVRDWLILQESERAIDSIVSTFISPRLNNNALQSVQQRAAELKDVQIRIHWSTNELIAVHNVEGKDFELSIKLAPNNPLTKPRVNCVGVSTNHTNWLTMFLSYQHGTLWEAVYMWMGSLQKKIEGSSVCCICYCRLQPTTGQLTKFVCYTCKNKFHTTCLYKWFRQSSKNTCPLCRKHF